MKNHALVNKPIRSCAVIGSGIAGLTVAHRLQALGCKVTVFEKSRGPGGRLAAKRVADGSVDVGAQYFTMRNPAFTDFLNEKAGKDTFARWLGSLRYQFAEGGWSEFRTSERYVGVPRMTAVSRALANGLVVKPRTRIERFERTESSGWGLFDTEQQAQGDFDAIVITAPPEQSRILLSDSGLKEEAQSLEIWCEGMSACWAMACRFDNPLYLPFEGAQLRHKVVYWLANNSSKPERDEAGEWWVIHAQPAWTAEHTASDPEWVKQAMLSAFSSIVERTEVPAETVMHRWLYARSAPQGSVGHLSFADQRIGIAGDWLNGGRVEGAFESADGLVSAWHQADLLGD